MRTELSDLAEQAADELLAVEQATDESRTPHVRRLANILFDMRALCTDPSGRGPDYAGKSREYRKALAAVYRSLSDYITPSRMTTLKSLTRYHMSTIIRERLADQPDVLVEYGYQERSQRERDTAWKQQRRAMVKAGVLDSDDSHGHAAQLVHGARHLVDLAAEEGTDGLSREARDYIVSGLRQVVSHIPKLSSGPAAVELARDLLAATEPESIRYAPTTARDAADDALTDISEYATRLRDEIVSPDQVVSDIEDLLDRYGTQHRRMA